MLSNKIGVRNLVEICAQKGIRQVIISPGSRNAPLTISFNQHGCFQCLSIPDERVAGFFAMGIAQQTRKPVIITCTSGTAALNFAPAIAEAFYQKIPLLILTADRPAEWINQGEGQSIQQRNVFANYVKRSYELPQEAKTKDSLWSNNRIICEAIDQTTQGSFGPVHINIPFREPLYDTKNYKELALPKIIYSSPIKKILPKKELQTLASKWNSTNKKIILCGLLPIKPKSKSKLNALLKKISKDPAVIILTETTSNLFGKKFICNFDGVLTSVSEKEISAFKADLLLSIGTSIISKKIKLFIRNNKPKVHWHIEDIEYHFDTFQALTRIIGLNPTAFFEQLLPNLELSTNKSTYQKLWLNRKIKIKKLQKNYLKRIEWSDLQVFNILLPRLPKDTNLHMGNSTPVRYIQLFKPRADIVYNSNRGVAGIDGSTSTAAGAAFINKIPTTIITGDIAFFYDSNAFWQQHLSPYLRVILINNTGGNIFRFIKGPDTTQELDNYFETHQERNPKYIAKTFNLAYFIVKNEKELKEVLPDFYKKQKNNCPAILEIKTPRLKNAEIWRKYYQFLSPLRNDVEINLQI